MNTYPAKKHSHDHETLREYIALLENATPEAASSLQQLTISILQRKSPIPFDLLVQLVADELYRQELHDGAWVLDLGLFGRALFVADVASAIRAGNGTFWLIEKKQLEAEKRTSKSKVATMSRPGTAA